jgi:hypothetical protein
MTSPFRAAKEGIPCCLAHRPQGSARQVPAAVYCRSRPLSVGRSAAKKRGQTNRHEELSRHSTLVIGRLPSGRGYGREPVSLDMAQNTATAKGFFMAEDRDKETEDIPPEWLAEFEAAANRSLEQRVRYGFIKTARSTRWRNTADGVRRTCRTGWASAEFRFPMQSTKRRSKGLPLFQPPPP